MNSNQTLLKTPIRAAQPHQNIEQRPVVGACNPLLMLLSGLLLAVILLMASPVHAKPNTNDTVTIEYLIKYVSQSDMTFVRNFGEHSPQKAAKHIRKKYDHFLDDINSPESFIALCATKSLMTGRDYTVTDPQGNISKTSDWLLGALETYREQGKQ